MVDMIYIKMHETESGTILAMCDKDLIGSVIEEGDVYINVRDYSEFYAGRLVDPRDAHSMIDRTEIHSASVIGKESVAVAVEKGIVERANVREAMGVLYANSYRVGLKR